MSLLERFRRIERSRAERPEADADASPETAERFENVERPDGRPPAPRASGADLDRFGPEPPPRIELLETDAGERPFTRCMRCGMDHNVFATACTGCGASLDTEAQRAFNERLWARRQEESAAEARSAEERRILRSSDGAELARSRRAMGEELARDVGRRERLRLEGEGIGSGWGALWRLLAGAVRALRGDRGPP